LPILTAAACPTKRVDSDLASTRPDGVALALVCKRSAAFVVSGLVPVKKAGSRSRNGFSQASEMSGATMKISIRRRMIPGEDKGGYDFSVISYQVF
jgi:hypothetical protein